jgi:hypothetical protein
MELEILMLHKLHRKIHNVQDRKNNLENFKL